MKVILTESQIQHLIEASVQEINAEANNTNTHPTDPQKEAGNYKMGHVSIKGMKISIENPRGSIRKFKKDDGTYGSVKMKNHYGYFGGTSGNGKDGDAVDVFIGPNPEGFERVYVVDQNNKDGEFDESKVMIGFNSKSEAKKAYLSNFDQSWNGFKAITGVSLKLFKKWLYRKHKQRKPFSEYVEIQKKKLEESKLLNEAAYVDRIKNNKAMIHYERNRDGGSDRTSGNKNQTEKIGTKLMDNDNPNDTYKVKLKNGFECYNITSIVGTNIMHYFKHHFSNEANNQTIKISGKDYNLDMEEKEFRDFMNRFKRKVEIIIKYHLKNASDKLKLKFPTISIYPVKSSSNFNQKMAEELSRLPGLCNMNVQVIDQNILSKDLRDVTIDTDFVNKNHKFYDSPMFVTGGTSVRDNLYHDAAQFQSMYKARQLVKYVNTAYDTLIRSLSKVNNPKQHQVIVRNFMDYVDCINMVKKEAKYFDNIAKKESSSELGKIMIPEFEKSKNEKDKADAIERTKRVKVLARSVIGDMASKINGKKYINIPQPICRWVEVPFKIQNSTNGVRMGLKNIYRLNYTEDSPMQKEKIEREIERIKGTLFVLFDDNVSGGATLSDVCNVFKTAGIKEETIVPITFGQMNEKWTIGRLSLNRPILNIDKNGKKTFGFNFTDDPSLSPIEAPEYVEAEKIQTQIVYGHETIDSLYMKIVNRKRGEKIEGLDKLFKVRKEAYEFLSRKKKPLKILWVDDLRNPYVYTIKDNRGTGSDTVSWENNILAFDEWFEQYSITFDWVHNFDEFKQYITSNGVPAFISFDRDLDKASNDKKNGEDCAEFLVKYCKKHKLQIPQYYIHSANSEAYRLIATQLGINKLYTPSHKDFSFDIKSLRSGKKQSGEESAEQPKTRSVGRKSITPQQPKQARKPRQTKQPVRPKQTQQYEVPYENLSDAEKLMRKYSVPN